MRSMRPMLRVLGTGEELPLPGRLIVAGYTGRDVAAVEEHIAELAAIGVPRPPSVPAFYDLDAALLTTSDVIDVAGHATSGEAEPVLVRHDGRLFLTVGSDHTDRDLERADIRRAKAACPKPLGTTVVELPGAAAWDELTIESRVDGRLYQRGSAGALRHPAELLARLPAVTGDLVLFCGTPPLLDGAFVYGSAWRVTLTLPERGGALTCAYRLARPAHGA